MCEVQDNNYSLNEKCPELHKKNIKSSYSQQ